MPLLMAMLFGVLLIVAAEASVHADPVGNAQDGKPATAPGKATDISTESDPASINQGQSLFNQICAHCHGRNAVTGRSERNLRHLRTAMATTWPTSTYRRSSMDVPTRVCRSGVKSWTVRRSIGSMPT